MQGSNQILGAFIISKILDISGRSPMESAVSVSSNQIIGDHLWRWSTYFGRNIQIEICCSIFGKAVHCLASLNLCREFGKGIKSVFFFIGAIPLGWPGLIGKCSIFLKYSHWSLTGQFGLMKAPPDKFDSFFHSAKKRLSCFAVLPADHRIGDLGL